MSYINIDILVNLSYNYRLCMGRLLEKAPQFVDKEAEYLDSRLLEVLRENPLYKSGDIPISQDLQIPPLTTRSALFLLTPEQVEFLQHVPLRAISRMKVSVRSRLAQGGVNIGGVDGMQDFGVQSRIGNGYKIWLPVENRSQRPVQIPDGMPVFRYFKFNPENQIVGGDLKKLVNRLNSPLTIDGSYDFSKDGKMIELPVDPSTVMAVRPAFGRHIATPHDGERRQVINPELYPIMPSYFPQLGIGETDFVKIGEGVEGELHTQTKLGMIQSNSLIMDCNVTSHRIRTEIGMKVDPQWMENPPHDSVYLSLYRK